MFKWGGLVNIKWNSPFRYPNYALTHDPKDELPKFGYMSKKKVILKSMLYFGNLLEPILKYTTTLATSTYVCSIID